MRPYAASKVHRDYLMRMYYYVYDIKSLGQERLITRIPVLLSNSRKSHQKIGFSITRTLQDIIRDQINHYLDLSNRKIVEIH